MATEGTIVDEALDEIVTALGSFEPLLEGLRDYARLNLRPETLTVVEGAIQEHERRMEKLQAARGALDALLQDGYPLLSVHEVEQAVFDDLKSQFDSITAAFGHFSPEALASSLGLSAGPVEPKA